MGAAAGPGMHTRVPPAPSARKRKLIKHSLDPAGESGLEQQTQPAGKRQATHHVNAGSARGAPRDSRFVPREHCMQILQAGQNPQLQCMMCQRLLGQGCGRCEAAAAIFGASAAFGMSVQHLFMIFQGSGADRVGPAVWSALWETDKAVADSILSDHSS